MSTDITGSINILADLVNLKALDLSTVRDALSINAAFSFAFGTGANQINVLYHDTIVLADGANTTLNLYNSGTLKDAFGADLTLSALKFLYVFNNSTDATLLLLGGNSADLPICSNATDQIKIPPGTPFIYVNPSAAGIDITTNKNLRIEHDGTGESTMAVDIVIGGLD